MAEIRGSEEEPPFDPVEALGGNWFRWKFAREVLNREVYLITWVMTIGKISNNDYEVIPNLEGEYSS